MKSIEQIYKENPWKMVTIILIILNIILIIWSLSNYFYGVEKENRRICSMIEAVPAWIDQEGGIIGYGLISNNQSNKEFSDMLTKTLVENKIKFVYSSNCGICQIQIQTFGEENFNKIKQSGLTLECN